MERDEAAGIVKSGYTTDSPESAAKECENKVTLNKKIFEQSSETKPRSPADATQGSIIKAECKTDMTSFFSDSNEAVLSESSDARASQNITAFKENVPDLVNSAADTPSLQDYNRKIETKLSEACKSTPLLKDLLMNALLSTFKQAMYDSGSTPDERAITDALGDLETFLKATDDLLESIGSLKDATDLAPSLCIVLNKQWFAKQVEEITVNPKGNEMVDVKSVKMAEYDDIQQMVKNFMAIVKENAGSESVHFGYKISDQSDRKQPLYFELTNGPHKAKQVALPRPIMRQDITASSVEANDIKIQWTSQQSPTNTFIVGYEIYVKCEGNDDEKTVKVGPETQSYTIEKLMADCEYRFGVAPLCESNIRLPACEFSAPFHTKKEPTVHQSSVSASSQAEQTSILSLASPAKIGQIEKKLRKTANGTRWYTVGEKADESLPEKVILVVGGTGCGKSTLINALANYLYNVQFEDAARYKVITEQDELEESGTSSAGRSKTKFVSAYEFGAMRDLPYRLTLVDTPGFGDTEGVEKDRRTVGYIKEWFSQEKKKISAVCIVIKYNETRIKPQVQYELHSVISLFGKNVDMNVFMLFTFCDGSTPPTIAALKEMKLPLRNATFNINSSAVLTLPSERQEENEDDLIIAKYYWKMSMDSFQRFIDELKAVKDESLSVSLTVLRKREILDTLVRNIPIHVRRIEFLEDIVEQIKSQREDIESGYIKTLSLSKLEPKRNNKEAKSRNCRECQMTCHKDCDALDPLTQQGNCLMFVDESTDLDSTTVTTPTKCQVCGCAETVHELENWIYEMQEQQSSISTTDVVDESPINSSSYSTQQSASNLLQHFYKQLIKGDTQFNETLKRIEQLEMSLANVSLAETHKKTAIGRLEDEIISERGFKSSGYNKRISILERHREALRQSAVKSYFNAHWEEKRALEHQPLHSHAAKESKPATGIKKCVML